MTSSQPVRIAHRGASGRGLAPENTLIALEKALEIGTDAVEMDVHMTRDGRVVVIHDETLDRTTDRWGAVCDLTLEQTRQADAGGWFGAGFRGTRVPTLEEALELLEGKALALVEIKAEGIAEAVVKVVQQMGARDNVVLQSFSTQTVQDVAEIDPGLPTGLITGDHSRGDHGAWAIGLCHQLSELGANLLTLQHGSAGPEVVRQLHLRGFAVWVWTVDKVADLRRMAASGVDGIITNYPNRLNAVLAGRTQSTHLVPA